MGFPEKFTKPKAVQSQEAPKEAGTFKTNPGFEAELPDLVEKARANAKAAEEAKTLKGQQERVLRERKENLQNYKKAA